MMDFLNFRNVQDLQLAENHPNYKKLEKFLKKLRIKVLSGTGGKRSRIRGIVPAGGYGLIKVRRVPHSLVS